MFCNLKVQVVSSCTERNPIGRRTQSDQVANATRLLPSTFIYENGN